MANHRTHVGLLLRLAKNPNYKMQQSFSKCYFNIYFVAK